MLQHIRQTQSTKSKVKNRLNKRLLKYCSNIIKIYMENQADYCTITLPVMYADEPLYDLREIGPSVQQNISKHLPCVYFPDMNVLWVDLRNPVLEASQKQQYAPQIEGVLSDSMLRLVNPDRVDLNTDYNIQRTAIDQVLAKYGINKR